MLSKEKKKNYGKQFEQVVKKSFEKIPNVSIDRIPDQVTRYKGASSNICDFVVYKYPYLYYIECKTVHGDRFPFSNIRENQWEGLLAKSKIDGVKAGVLVWYVDHDVTKYIPIQILQGDKDYGMKSFPYSEDAGERINGEMVSTFFIGGKKKRVFFEYDMNDFFIRCK